MMAFTMQYTGTLTIVTCYACGTTFAIPEDLNKRCLADHVTSFYCPLGHGQHYVGETETEKLARQLRAQRQNSEWYQDQLQASERSKAAIKGHLTRARNKVADGNCPAPGCGQHFSNVREHMKHIHPDFKLLDPETGKVATL